jgi:hypothetical protein
LTIPNERFLGDLNIPGILDITSTSAEMENLQWLSPVAMHNVEQPLSNALYILPEMDKIPRQIPVYLPLLYWNSALPSIPVKIAPLHLSSDCTGTFDSNKGFLLMEK